MAKKARVWTGTEFVELASAQTDLTAYSTTAQMNTAITAELGLTLINTTTFSAVSSQSFNNVFSATYDNYVVLMNLAPSGGQIIRFRYRVSGADNATTNYSFHNQVCSSSSNAYAATSGNAATAFFFTSSDGLNSVNSVNVTIFRPFLTATTMMTGLHNLSATSGAAPISGGVIQTSMVTATSFTGFSIFPDSGTVSGTVRIYGVKN